MSIQSEIDRIEQNVANTYTALSDLGADMPAEQNSDNLVQTVGNVKAVLYIEQTLSDEEQAQARENVGAASQTDLQKLSNEKVDQTYVDNEIADLKVQGVQQTPLFAESVEWLEENGDQSKVYVLPDGDIYAYMMTEVETGGYTNQVPISKNTDGTVYNATGYKDGYRVSSSGAEKTSSNGTVTGYIPVSGGDIVRFYGPDFTISSSGNSISAYDSGFNYLGQAGPTSNYGIFLASGGYNAYGKDSITQGDDNVWIWTVPPSASGVAYIRLSGYKNEGCYGASVVLTVNEPIVEKTTTTAYGWANTGYAFVPADYEDRIIALEDAVQELGKQDMQSEKLTRTAVNALPAPESKAFSITENPNRMLIWSDGYVWRNVSDDRLTHTASSYQTTRASDGVVIAQTNESSVYSAHSITKVLTAVAVCKNVSDLSATITVTDDDCFDSTSYFVKAGDVVSYETLLHCALIPSDNHAARAMARTIGYMLNPAASDDTAARNAFAAELTRIMEDIGMNGSDVRETAADSGLHTTAADLCTLYKYVLTNRPEITAIWGKLTYTVSVAGSNARTWSITSTTNSNARAVIPEFVGGKTGSNDSMGAYAFVWDDKNDGERYITAFLEYDLSTDSRWSNARQNVDEVYSLKNG